MDYQRIDDQDMLRLIECAYARAHELLGKIHNCSGVGVEKQGGREVKGCRVCLCIVRSTAVAEQFNLRCLERRDKGRMATSV